MLVIELDASRWTSAADFYRALLRDLRAPEWHGGNVNALIDSVAYGGMNKVEPPFTIRIIGTSDAHAEVLAELALAQSEVAEANAGVTWELKP